VTIADYDGSVQVDEMFIAVETYSDENDERKTYKFISMKTFQLERSGSSSAKYSAYDKGYLLLLNKNFIRILDVSSGTFLRDIRIKLDQLDSINCCANSNYVALLSYNYYYSKLYVYDLKCLKEIDVVPSHLLLTSINLERDGMKIAMNEHRIVCLGDVTMCVVDLKPIDRLRCASHRWLWRRNWSSRKSSKAPETIPRICHVEIFQKPRLIIRMTSFSFLSF
jgi:hypothetical protein